MALLCGPTNVGDVVQDLVSIFLSDWEGELFQEVAAFEGLESALDGAYEAAVQAWPEVSVGVEDFLVHLRHSLQRYPSKKGVADWFVHLQSGDLYLAYACLLGQEQALLAFEQTYAATIDAALRRFHRSHVAEDDLRQILREKLFLDEPGRVAKLRSYSGQGLLENWLRVTAVRVFLDALRKGGHQKHEHMGQEEALLEAPDMGLDMELSFLKAEYRGLFKESFRVALQALETRERNVLYQHIVARLSIDQIGALYHIHRSTAARQLEKARASLFSKTRKEMMKRLKVSSQEFESIMHLIQSRLDVSVARMLRDHVPEEER